MMEGKGIEEVEKWNRGRKWQSGMGKEVVN